MLYFTSNLRVIVVLQTINSRRILSGQKEDEDSNAKGERGFKAAF
jgi:hypothetical protein